MTTYLGSQFATVKNGYTVTLGVGGAAATAGVTSGQTASVAVFPGYTAAAAIPAGAVAIQ